jgi:hypothetical protein
VQTHNVQRSQQIAASIDSNTDRRQLPLAVLPADMQRQYLLLESKQHAVDTRLVKRAASSEKQILQAWRWKSLLIQTTLLSALNGICHELSNEGRVPHCIAAFRKVGMEVDRDTLTLQNFILDIPNAWSNTPTYCVRDRCFFEETPTLSPVAGEGPVDLLKCKFSPKFRGKHRLSKKVWREDSVTPDTQYFVKGDKIISYPLPIESQSLIFEADPGEAEDTEPDNWFENCRT